MANPLASGKQTVSLASPGVRGSRIRRDPPPPVKEIAVADPDERDARTVILGILTVALILIVILIGFSNAIGWSPRQYTAYI